MYAVSHRSIAIFQDGYLRPQDNITSYSAESAASDVMDAFAGDRDQLLDQQRGAARQVPQVAPGTHPPTTTIAAGVGGSNRGLSDGDAEHAVPAVPRPGTVRRNEVPGSLHFTVLEMIISPAVWSAERGTHADSNALQHRCRHARTRGPPAASAAPPFPEVIELPSGCQPEGIAAGRVPNS